jgi:hypothetical protein
VGAALTTPGRCGTARRVGSGKQEGKVHARNQLKPLKFGAVLKPGGYGPVMECVTGNRADGSDPGELPGRCVVAGREVSVKVCGVAETMLQGW